MKCCGHSRQNPFGETISESNQITELHETRKDLHEEVMFSDASFNKSIYI